MYTAGARDPVTAELPTSAVEGVGRCEGAPVPPRASLDADDIVAWVTRARDVVAAHRDELNRLNVFPVADADTGVNMAATLDAAVRAADAAIAARPVTRTPADQTSVLRALGRGAVRGARGNSGIILSQLLRALGDECADGVLDAARLPTLAARAHALMLAAVSKPVEGTMISVLGRAAARLTGEEPADEPVPADLAGRAHLLGDVAARELMRTPDHLPELRDAGVVDSGAHGLVLILDALIHVITGATPVRPRPRIPGRDELVRRAAHAGLATPSTTPAETPAQPLPAPPEPELEVMYVLSDVDRDAVAALRTELEGIGNSVVIVDDGGTGAPGGTHDTRAWTVHVHTEAAGAAIERGLARGRISDIHITSLQDAGYTTSEPRRAGRSVNTGRVLVALAPEGPVAELFRAAGARVLDRTPDMDLDDVLGFVEDIRENDIVLLPNGRASRKDLSAVDAALETMLGAHVLILPTSSLIQGLAAVAVHDPTRSVVVDAYMMTEAASDTRRASLSTATERALTFAGPCEAGDALGIIGNDVLVVSPDLGTCGRLVLDYMLQSGGERVTLLRGAAATDALLEAMSSYVRVSHPEVELVVLEATGIEDIVQIGVE